MKITTKLIKITTLIILLVVIVGGIQWAEHKRLYDGHLISENFMNSATSRSSGELWPLLNGLVLLTVPFLPLSVPLHHPSEPPTSLAYAAYTSWKDTLEYLHPTMILWDIWFATLLASFWIVALMQLRTMKRGHNNTAVSLAIHAIALLIGSYVLVRVSEAEALHWTFWAACIVMVSSWGRFLLLLAKNYGRRSTKGGMALE